MRVGVVMTVKNEARLLRQNILYHLGLGIDKVYVYLDNTTDHGDQTVSDLKAVEINNSVSPESYKNVPYLEKFWSNAAVHHTARQCLNTYDAIQKCKTERIDWLISLDADELFLTTKDQRQSLKEFFIAASNEGADIVNLKPMEVIARKTAYKNVMQEETLFKTQKNFNSKFDQIYQKIFDPYQNSYLTVSYWLGHTMGKGAINIQSSVIPNNVHRYSAIDGSELNIHNNGYILHYHSYDFEDFIKKFQNFKTHPDTFLSGNKIEDLKSLWIKLVNDKHYSRERLMEYFEKNLLFTPSKLKRLNQTRMWNLLKRKESAVISIDLPKQILDQVQH
ncbi:glycosyltransferase family 2 protein [Winogradskyella psychrotolerans]|uniref:glycosyltransferase family 2 protein n=1 Tax=Winogradskyella psychrotolerans TaxID=1344585 RepID=UPI001C075526|nr:glycosyltransferase family 2 protein [Winogradskyella psychrotolerans]MBU2929551.1 glycosyltransferase family 2 protein [Winogradskyella psychrotolerans]